MKIQNPRSRSFLIKENFNKKDKNLLTNIAIELASICDDINPCDQARTEVRKIIKAHGQRLGERFYLQNYILFNKAFFIKNYIKAFITIKYAYEHNYLSGISNFFDLGGAGPVSLAIQHIFMGYNNTSNKNIYLFEQSTTQIELAQKIVEKSSALMVGMSTIPYKYYCKNIFNHNFFYGENSISIFSYVFCEHTNLIKNISPKLIGKNL